MSQVWLLDSSVLIALSVAEHEHHQRASEWIKDVESWAVCPVVEGSLARFLIRVGESANTTQAFMRGLRDVAGMQFWPDSLSYGETDFGHVRGHRQVTDAYLVSLAVANGALLATLDAALALARPDGAVLIPAAGDEPAMLGR